MISVQWPKNREMLLVFSTRLGIPKSKQVSSYEMLQEGQLS